MGGLSFRAFEIEVFISERTLDTNKHQGRYRTEKLIWPNLEIEGVKDKKLEKKIKPPSLICNLLQKVAVYIIGAFPSCLILSLRINLL